MQNKIERTKIRERVRFGYVSIARSPRISARDLILTGSCHRYDRVITVLTPPFTTSPACHTKRNDDAQFSATAVYYQRDHLLNTILKMSDDNLGMC